LIRKLLALSTTDSPFLILSTMAMIMGFQSLLMGLIAELTVRTYHESQSKPTYNVRYSVNTGGADRKMRK
jgi:hypothetical protein